MYQSKPNEEYLANQEQTETPEAESIVVQDTMGPDTLRRLERWNDEKLANRPVTCQQFRRILGNAKLSKVGRSFRDAVAEIWPGYAERYLAEITEPMDLSKLQQEGLYKTLGEFKKKLTLIFTNSVSFNGPHHELTAAAFTLVEKVWTECLQTALNGAAGEGSNNGSSEASDWDGPARGTRRAVRAVRSIPTDLHRHTAELDGLHQNTSRPPTDVAVPVSKCGRPRKQRPDTNIRGDREAADVSPVLTQSQRASNNLSTTVSDAAQHQPTETLPEKPATPSLLNEDCPEERNGDPVFVNEDSIDNVRAGKRLGSAVVFRALHFFQIASGNAFTVISPSANCQPGFILDKKPVLLCVSSHSALAHIDERLDEVTLYVSSLHGEEATEETRRFLGLHVKKSIYSSSAAIPVSAPIAQQNFDDTGVYVVFSGFFIGFGYACPPRADPECWRNLIYLILRPLSDEEKVLAAEICKSGQVGILWDPARSDEQLTNKVLQRKPSKRGPIAEVMDAVKVQLVELQRLQKTSEEVRSVVSELKADSGLASSISGLCPDASRSVSVSASVCFRIATTSAC